MHDTLGSKRHALNKNQQRITPFLKTCSSAPFGPQSHAAMCQRRRDGEKGPGACLAYGLVSSELLWRRETSGQDDRDQQLVRVGGVRRAEAAEDIGRWVCKHLQGLGAMVQLHNGRGIHCRAHQPQRCLGLGVIAVVEPLCHCSVGVRGRGHSNAGTGTVGCGQPQATAATHSDQQQ